MLVFAFAVSPIFYFIGINSLNKTEGVVETSLWELVNQSANIGDSIFLDETYSIEAEEIK